MKHTDECNCVGAQFIEHIKQHLLVGQDVICKICGKTPTEIAKENASQQEDAADVVQCVFTVDGKTPSNCKYVYDPSRR